MRGRLPAELMPYFPALAVIAGLLFGSFLNVCIYRVPRDLSVVTPRSFCPQCGVAIHWYDNVPVLSYVMLRGRARCCGVSIGVQYVAVELMTTAAFLAVALRYGWTPAALKWMAFEAILVVLFWTDLQERILPDEFTLGGTALGLVFALMIPVPGIMGQLILPNSKMAWQSLLEAGLGALLTAGPLWLVGAVYLRLRGREGLGLGDVKLLILIGVFLGLEQSLAALLVSTVAGSIIGLAYIWWKRKTAATYELPLGTFLCAGGALAPLLGTFAEMFRANGN